MNNSENLPTDNNNKSIVKGKTMYNWESHDNQDKVIVDSINAIERNREHMTDEQLRKAYAELQTGLGPDIYSQLCDRKASDPTTCNYILFAAQSSAAATTASMS